MTLLSHPSNAVEFPKALIPVSADHVWSVSYPDFVGMINQTNVMPGAYTTLSRWAMYSRMNERSHLLEVACTTGFASRELVRMTGCSAVSFDLSDKAVAMAHYNHHQAAPESRRRYLQSDGYAFESDEEFTHIVVGSALGFFPDPSQMLQKCLSWLADSGYILATAFYSDEVMPEHVIERRRSVFGIPTLPETYKQAITHYAGLNLMYEHRSAMYQETAEEIEHYVLSTINRVCQQADIQDDAIRTAMIERLRLVKETTNLLRQYQHYAVLVYQYHKQQYPNRYVELF
jgi:SAM-dependent methyltransferase